MERKHYIIVGISIALALCPVFSLELLSVAIFGALLGMGALFWTMRSVDSEDRRLKAEIERVNKEIIAAQEAQKAAEAHAGELDKFFNENGYAELTEVRQQIEIERADFDRQLEAKRIEFEQTMEREWAAYEKEVVDRNAQQEQILQEKTALEMKLQKEIAELTARRDGALEFVQKYDVAQGKYATLIE